MTSMILACHKDVNSIMCVLDLYGQMESIKDYEREYIKHRVANPAARPHPQCVHESMRCLPLSTRVQDVCGDVRSYSIDLLRTEKLCCQKTKSLMRLPPDDDGLKQHITHANFLA